MRRRRFLALAAVLPAAVRADPPEIQLEDLISEGRKLIEENVDPAVLAQIDTKQIEAWLREFEREFEGEYVLDLAQAGATARLIVPLLERSEPLRPYGAWLRTRLDYFTVADELRVIIGPPAGPPPPAPRLTNQPPRRPAAPPPASPPLEPRITNAAPPPRPPTNSPAPPVPTRTQAPPASVPGPSPSSTASPPVKPPSPAVPAPVRTNPPPETIRQVWVRQVEREPMPAGAREFTARLRPVFASQHAPPALVWLAEVESSFDPTARSPAGAVGLYQLMPATAKEGGLRLWPHDERLDPVKNAHAAALKLHRLYGEFGDWRLSLAAYNAGDGRVRTALQRSRVRSFDGIARHLPAETQLYVPKVEATLRKRAGVPLDRLTAA